MLRRFHEQRRALGYYAADIDISIITFMQRELMDRIIKLLQPFKELQNKNLAIWNIFLFIPSVIILQKYITSPSETDQTVIVMKKSLLLSLTYYFNDKQLISKDKMNLVATALAPRFKCKL